MMSYFNELSFASGYYHINPDGTVTFAEETPEEIKKRFLQIWLDIRKKIIKEQDSGIFSSAYPILQKKD